MFKVKMPDAIKADVMAGLITDIDKREGSFSYDMSGPLAEELNKMYEALNKIQPMVWVDETSGIYLDMAAEDIGMEPRKTGTKAQTVLDVKGTAGYTIPAKTSFMTGDDLIFDTDEDAVIQGDGVVQIPSTARDVGKAYNVEAESILYSYTNDSRLTSVSNPEAAIGGTDPETDKSLFDRLQFARQRPATSGNKNHYVTWARAVSGVGAVKVFPLWNGNGTVKVLIANDDRQPVDQAVVTACAAHIEEERPTTARVTVVSATGHTIDVTASIKLEQGVGQDLAYENIRKGLSDYFQSISLIEYEVRYNKTGAILMDVPGVLDYADLTLSGKIGTIYLSKEDVPVLGEVALQWI